MKRSQIIVIISVLLSPLLSAQQAHWKTKVTKDGLVSVTFDFSDLVDPDGKKLQVLEYVAKTTARVSLEKCVAVMKNDVMHKEFMKETEDTRRVKDISENEWVTYYFMKARWPMPEADVVTHYKVEEDPDHKRFILTGTPAPDLYPDQDMERMKHNHTKYTFTDLGNGKVELVMYSSSIPLVSVPKWLISTWIPNGPADMLNGIVRLAE